jgi:hypothetical protein
VRVAITPILAAVVSAIAKRPVDAFDARLYLLNLGGAELQDALEKRKVSEGAISTFIDTANNFVECLEKNLGACRPSLYVSPLKAKIVGVVGEKASETIELTQKSPFIEIGIVVSGKINGATKGNVQIARTLTGQVLPIGNITSSQIWLPSFASSQRIIYTYSCDRAKNDEDSLQINSNAKNRSVRIPIEISCIKNPLILGHIDSADNTTTIGPTSCTHTGKYVTLDPSLQIIQRYNSDWRESYPEGSHCPWNQWVSSLTTLFDNATADLAAHMATTGVKFTNPRWFFGINNRSICPAKFLTCVVADKIN